jgi:hypothetical protein
MQCKYIAKTFNRRSPEIFSEREVWAPSIREAMERATRGAKFPADCVAHYHSSGHRAIAYGRHFTIQVRAGL